MNILYLPGGGFITLAPNESPETISFVLNTTGTGLGRMYSLSREQLAVVEVFLDSLNSRHYDPLKTDYGHLSLAQKLMDFQFYGYGSAAIVAGMPNTSFLKKHIPDAEVYIALPQRHLTLRQIEDIQNACGDFMEAMGFELEQKEEPVMGSFFQKIKFILKSKKTHDEISDIYSKGKMALEQAHLNLPNAEITEKMSMAATNVMASLANVDEAVIRLAGIVVVKYQAESGKTRVAMTTLSPELTILFDANPQLMNEPATVFKMIEAIKNQPNKFVIGDEATPPQIP